MKLKCFFPSQFLLLLLCKMLMMRKTFGDVTFILFFLDLHCDRFCFFKSSLVFFNCHESQWIISLGSGRTDRAAPAGPAR